MEVENGVAKPRPRLFIASSREGECFAKALHYNLQRDAEVTVWSTARFKPSQSTLANLIEQLDHYDAAAFIFSPDDTLSIRRETLEAVRDNVVFEAGLFMGRLSPDRCFLVAPEGRQFHLLTDLSGVQMLFYEANRSDSNWRAALSIPAEDIKLAIKAMPLSRAFPFEVRIVREHGGHLQPSREDELLAACLTRQDAEAVASTLGNERKEITAVWQFETNPSAPIVPYKIDALNDDPRWHVIYVYPF